MNLEKAFKFPFKGENWVKNLLIAAGLLLTGIGGIVVAGYGLEIIRNMDAKKSDDVELPEWTNFGENVMDGLKMLVVMLVWMAPVIVLSFFFGIASAIIQNLMNYDNYSVMNAIFILMNIANILLSTALTFILYGFFPTIMGEVATKQTIQAGLNFKTIFALNKGFFWKNFLVSLVGGIIVSFVSSVGVLACFIGVFVTAAYSFAFIYHLYGQQYLKINGAVQSAPVVAE